MVPLKPSMVNLRTTFKVVFVGVVVALVFLLLLLLFVLTARVSVHHFYARCPWRPEEELNPLELEFPVFASLHVGSGN